MGDVSATLKVIIQAEGEAAPGEAQEEPTQPRAEAQG
jgi:hypothetical protein